MKDRISYNGGDVKLIHQQLTIEISTSFESKGGNPVTGMRAWEMKGIA
jgi:hypothetical protein